MSENVHESGGTGPSHRTVEIAVAGVLALLAIIGMYGSVKVGITLFPYTTLFRSDRKSVV